MNETELAKEMMRSMMSNFSLIDLGVFESFTERDAIAQASKNNFFTEFVKPVWNFLTWSEFDKVSGMVNWDFEFLRKYIEAF